MLADVGLSKILAVGAPVGVDGWIAGNNVRILVGDGVGCNDIGWNVGELISEIVKLPEHCLL